MEAERGAVEAERDVARDEGGVGVGAGGEEWRQAPQARALLRALARTTAQRALFTQAVAAQLGIGPTDLDCLALLHDLGPATPGQLAETLGLTTGAITGVVDRLVSAGFVLREGDPTDRRRVIVRPVAERQPAVDAAQMPLRASIERSLHSASAADLQRLLDFHAYMADVFQRETARVRAESTSASGASEFSAPLGDLQTGVLEFANGAAGVRVAALDHANYAQFATPLFAARFDGVQPSVRVQAGSIVFRYRRVGPFEWGRSKQAGTVELNDSIPWSIVVRGGASTLDLDATSLVLRDLALRGGANKVELRLPRPSGTVRLCLDDGVSRVQIQRPAGVPAQLEVRGGANRLVFDERRFGAVGGDALLASPGWDVAKNRYAIEIRGGASRLSIQELQEGFSRAHDLW